MVSDGPNVPCICLCIALSTLIACKAQSFAEMTNSKDTVHTVASQPKIQGLVISSSCILVYFGVVLQCVNIPVRHMSTCDVKGVWADCRYFKKS